MRIILTKKFQRQYRKKDSEGKEKVDETLKQLCKDPKHPGLHSHRVQRTKKVWECYIDDAYRVTFEYGDDCIICRNNCKHSIIDRNP